MLGACRGSGLTLCWYCCYSYTLVVLVKQGSAYQCFGGPHDQKSPLGCTDNVLGLPMFWWNKKTRYISECWILGRLQGVSSGVHNHFFHQGRTVMASNGSNSMPAEIAQLSALCSLCEAYLGCVYAVVELSRRRVRPQIVYLVCKSSGICCSVISDLCSVRTERQTFHTTECSDSIPQAWSNWSCVSKFTQLTLSFRVRFHISFRLWIRRIMPCENVNSDGLLEKAVSPGSVLGACRKDWKVNCMFWSLSKTYSCHSHSKSYTWGLPIVPVFKVHACQDSGQLLVGTLSQPGWALLEWMPRRMLIWYFWTGGCCGCWLLWIFHDLMLGVFAARPKWWTMLQAPCFRGLLLRCLGCDLDHSSVSKGAGLKLCVINEHYGIHFDHLPM